VSTLWRPSEAFPTQYGQSASELAASRKCRGEHMTDWVVIQRNMNASAFNGYRPQWSRYSAVRCDHAGCGRVWRTDADYVGNLPDARSDSR
jgi:hypothetical protein